MNPKNGAVVSAHSLASEAGASILRKGGNAADAAVAVGLALGVVEPAFSGIGGGGLALIHLSSGETVALDYRETAPFAATASFFGEDGSRMGVPDANSVGPLAIATPGMIAGYALMLESYGTMKLGDVARPAIEISNRGVSLPRLSDRVRTGGSSSLEKVRRFEGERRVMTRGEGDSVRLLSGFPLLSRTMATVGELGAKAFYEGEIPRTISREVQRLGGILSESDFGSYSVKVRKPVRGEYAGFEVMSMPPPSGGALIVQGLMILDRLREEYRSASEGGRLRLLALILGQMMERRKGIGDPDFTGIDVDGLLAEPLLRRSAGELSARAGMAKPGKWSGEAGSTSHYCVADSHGNVVAATETVECYFGSGVVVPELGVLMNDEMHDFETVPWMPNSVGPGKRPRSSMSPTILFKDGRPHLALGGAGATRIMSSIFQVIVNLAEEKMTLNGALARPRIHPAKDGVRVETGTSLPARSALRGLGGGVSVEKERLYFGGVHAILFDPRSGRPSGGADPRRLGKAVRV